MERLDFEDFKYSPIEATIHLARYLNAKPYIRGKRVLDAACGEGYGSRLMHDWGAASVVGVDISETAVQTAEKIFGNKNVKYIAHDVEELPFPDHSFDVVVSLETIEHLSNPSIFLKELRRVLKKNGTAIISCPNDNYYAQNIPDYTNIYHKKRYSWPEYKQLVEAEFGEPTQWYMGNSLSGYINLPLMYCNDPDSGEKAPANMQSIMQARRSSETEIVPQDQYVNHWVSVYYVAVWTQMEIDGSGESAAIYPVPTFFLHNDKKVPEVDPYDMVKALESQKQTLHDSYKEALEKLILTNKINDELSCENNRLKEENLERNTIATNLEALQAAHTALKHLQDTLTAEHDDLKQKYSALEWSRDQLSSEHDDLKQKYSALEWSRDQLSSEHDDLKQKYSALEWSRDQLSSEHDELKKEYSALEWSRDKLSSDYDELKKEYSALQCEHDSLTDSIDVGKSRLEEEVAQYALLQEQHKVLMQEQEQLNEYVAMMEEENRVLINERDRLKAMNAMMTEEQTLLNTQIAHSQWQADHFRDLFEADETKLYAKQQELDALHVAHQSELQSKQCEMEDLQKTCTDTQVLMDELRERQRVLTNERDRLKGMNGMLSEENSLLSDRAAHLLWYCGTVDEKVRLIEISEEYRFGLRCRPLLKVFRKPLLLVLRVARKVRNGFRKVFH